MSESGGTPPSESEGTAADASAAQSADAQGPKRKGKVTKKHTVGRVLLATAVVLALVVGLGTVLLYRHLNGNINYQNITEQLGTDRPPKKHTNTGPQDPINVLVMGSDDRDGSGNNIDNQDLGSADRSDTTILMHLSADRKHAYGISIPRDSLVNRPDCYDKSGKPTIQGGTKVMWNDAFALGGPACTVRQFEQITHIRVDNYVVVDFSGFEGMVDAVGGVPVCIPEPISDPAHGINIPAGTREIKGREALNYVRARYTLGDGSDISRIKRQQAFIAAMAHKVFSAGTFARPDRLIGFLDAATKSLTTDISSVVKLAKVGMGFKNIGLDNIKFITVPTGYYPADSPDAGRVYWVQPQTKQLWKAIADDEVLPPKFLNGAITAKNNPGNGTKGHKGHKPTPSQEQEAQANGLCA